MARTAQISAITITWLLSLCAIAFADTPERVALVIGNSAYSSVPKLTNPVNDANDIARSLERLEFDVTIATDLDVSGMNRALGQFSRKSRTADMAVLFYAGHGIEIDNQNYLIPTDANLSHVDDVSFQAVKMEQFLRAVEGAQTLKLVLLDACRDNPFAFEGSSTRSLGRGLTRVEPTGGILVSYAARGGTVAFDGEGRNSPYTTALLSHLEEPNLEIGKLFRRVRDAVYRDTGGMQEPFTYGSLPSRDIFLSEKIADPILEDFNVASADGSVAAWDTFIETHNERMDKPALLAAARSLREAALPTPEPVVDPIQGDFNTASADGSVAGWDAFLEAYGHRKDVPGLIAAARDLREVALPKPKPESVVVPIFDDFDVATAQGTVAAWDVFLKKYGQREADHFLMTAARNLRAVAQPTPVEAVQNTDPTKSPGIVALNLPEILTPEESEEALELTPGARKQVQRLLDAIGFQPGPADGAWGKRTRSAIASFQKIAGLQDTGFVNVATLTSLSETYDAAPKSLDGMWKLVLMRRGGGGRSADDVLLYDLAIVEFEIRGRTITTVKTLNLSNAPNPKDPALRATLSRTGRLEMSAVINYIYFQDTFRRVSTSIDLPKHVLVGQEFELPGRALSGQYRFESKLRRVSAE